MHQEIKQHNLKPAEKVDPQRYQMLELLDINWRTIMLTKFMEINLEHKNFIRELDTVKSDMSGTRKRCLLLSLLFIIVLEVLARTIRKNK